MELAAVWRRRVLPQIPQALGDEFTDEHRFMEAKPLGQLDLKRFIDGSIGPAGGLGLETRPRRVEGLKTALPVADFPEALSIQVFEQEPFLKGQEWPRDSPSGFENLLLPQQTKAESVQRSSPNSIRTTYYETAQFIFKILGSRPRKGADQYSICPGATLQKARNPPHERESFPSSGTG